jgi:hypothetical protein
MTPTCPLTLSVALPALVAAAVATAREGPEAPSPRPVLCYPTTAGTRWVLRAKDGRETEKVVTEVQWKEGTAVVTVAEVRAGGVSIPQAKYEVSDKGLLYVAAYAYDHTAKRASPVAMNPPVWLLKMPLTPGKTWEHRQADGIRHVYTVYSKERVRVPAGEYEATPVHVAWWFDDTSKWEYRYWHVHGVGAVQSAGQGATVLASFTKGKPNQ